MAEPVISDPEVHGPIKLDPTCQFIFLMSAGLWKNFADATGAETTVNADIAGLIAAEFSAQVDAVGDFDFLFPKPIQFRLP